MSKNLKKRIEILEEEALPQQFEEIKIINHLPGVLFEECGKKEFTIRVPVRRKRR